MQSRFSIAAAASAFLLAAQTAVAGGSFLGATADKTGHDWSAGALYEPCMNGEVSATGQFSSQFAEDKAMARMALTSRSE